MAQTNAGQTHPSARNKARLSSPNAPAGAALVTLVTLIVCSGPAMAQTPTPQPDTQRGVASLEQDERVARFRSILRKRPFHVPAFRGLVEHYATSGTLQELTDSYAEQADALPDDTAIKVVLARLHLRNGDGALASALLEGIEQDAEAIDRFGNDLLVFKAQLFRDSGEPDKARALLTRALDDAGSLSERFDLTEALADLQLATDDPEGAADTLRALGARFGDNYLHRRRVAEALAARSLHNAAIEEFRETLELARNDANRRCEILRQIGIQHEALDQDQRAIDAYTRAIDLLASDHWLQKELHERVVSLYRAGDRLDELIDFCRTRIRNAPEQTSTRLLLADVQFAAGDAQSAKQTLARAVELFPDDPVLSDRLIDLLDRTDDAEGVTAEYERAISRDPDNLELLVRYGQFLATRQRVDDARNQWRTVLDQAVGSSRMAMRLGRLFASHQLTEDAEQCFRHALELDPADPEPALALSRLMVSRGEKDQAVALLVSTIEGSESASHLAAISQELSGLGESGQALRAIDRACELVPNSIGHLTDRSDLLVRMGRVEEGLAARRAIIDLIPAPAERARRVEILVGMHVTADRLDELRSRELERLEAEPDNITSLLILAREADQSRDLVRSRELLERLLRIEPDNEPARVHLARVHEAIGDVESAVAEYERLIAARPNAARKYLESIATLRLRYNDKLGAVETFERLISRSPDNAATLADVADQFVRLERYERALELYESSLRLHPDNHEARLEYARTLDDAGRLERALEVYRVCAMQTSDREVASEALDGLHETAERLGALDTLLEDLEQEVARSPGNTRIAGALGRILIRELEYTRAMDVLDRILRHNPRDAEVMLVRCDLLRRLGRFEEALEGYRRLLRLPNIDRDYALGEMGKASLESGDLKGAVAAWEQINHTLYASSLMRNNGLLDEAIDLLRVALRQQADDAALWRSLVTTLQDAGRIDEALTEAQRLLNLDPDNVYNIEQVARAYLERGDRENAAAVAARLFAAGVGEQKDQSGRRSQSASTSNPYAARFSAQSQPQTNLDRGIAFFMENGLEPELKAVLDEQLDAQPNNGVLHLRAMQQYSYSFNEPERALELARTLETMDLPVEFQWWLGRSTQRDAMRLAGYQLLSSKPVLRDARLAELERIDEQDRTREHLIELAAIRVSQNREQDAVDLLTRAVERDASDVIALGSLVNLLVRSERYADAEPHARTLVGVLAARSDKALESTKERVRRDFVRQLPLRLQLRMTDELVEQVALKNIRGEAFETGFSDGLSLMGHSGAQMALATILAETGRLDDAETVWREMAPTHPADAESWTNLADVAQSHDRDETAFEFYEKALLASRELSRDPLLARVFGRDSSPYSWYRDTDGIDATFSRIVEMFNERDRMPELYEYLRETGQTNKARVVAERYELYDDLKDLYAKQLAAARQDFLSSTKDPLESSVPYLEAVVKLAELHDQTGDWDSARQVYVAYLEDFPDEIALLQTLGEAAEVEQRLDDAIAWERRRIEAQDRLKRSSRAWAVRELRLTPQQPAILESYLNRSFGGWESRWSTNAGWWWRRSDPLDTSEPYMRLARLHLATDNHIAAGDSMRKSIAQAGPNRNSTVSEALNLIRTHGLEQQMLQTLQAMAVANPRNQTVQLALARSLEANGRNESAVEVYKRMLKAGLRNLAVLAQVRQKMTLLDPEGSARVEVTIGTLESQAAEDPENARAQLRLARAYFYSLRIDDARTALEALVEDASHTEGVLDLYVDVLTVLGDREGLIDALRDQLGKSRDADDRARIAQRLSQELLNKGDFEDALAVLGEVASPQTPQMYAQLGSLLQLQGQHERAIEQFTKYRDSLPSDDFSGLVMLAKAWALKGDTQQAADRVLEHVQWQARQNTQYGGPWGMLYNSDEDPFEPYASMLALYPEIHDELRSRLERNHEQSPDDPLAAQTLAQFYRRIGRTDLADSITDALLDKGAGDAQQVMAVIDRKIRAREFDTAIRLATTFIDQQTKPQVPPGMPAEYATMVVLMSPKNLMSCKLGDVYWEMGRRDQAIETYRTIVDKDIEATRLAFASICLIRGRPEEFVKVIDELGKDQAINSQQVLQLRALASLVNHDIESALDDLAECLDIADDDAGSGYYGGYGSGSPGSTLRSLARMTGHDRRYIRELREQLDKNNNDWSNWQSLITELWSNGRTDEALALLDEAMNKPAFRRQALARTLTYTRDTSTPEQLIPVYEELIELSERSADERDSASRYRNALADILWDLGREDEAVALWLDRSDAQSSSTHARLGSLLFERRAYPRARDAYTRAIELDPENSTARTGLLQLAAADDDPRAAGAHLEWLFDNAFDHENIYDIDDLLSDRGTSPLLRRAAIWISSSPERVEASGVRPLTLAVLTGRWETAREELLARIETTPHDPVAWVLLGIASEKMGMWEQAARAWERVKDQKATDIANHKQQLKLVLAGDQIKTAAAGSRQSQPTGSSTTGGRFPRGMGGGYRSYGSGYYGYGYNRWDSVDTITRRLASIYINTGDNDKAEKLYMLSAGGSSHSAGNLAMLMWDRGDKARAIELLESAALESGSASLTQLIDMYAQAGRVQDAIDLAVRAYALADDQSRYNISGSSPTSLESWEDGSISSTLYELATRHGVLETAIADLDVMVRQNPNDPRASTLLLTILLKERRWEDARRVLDTLAQARPGDPVVRVERLHVLMQLGRWDDALALLEELRTIAKQSHAEWDTAEAFVHLMRGDKSAALSAIEPLLTTDSVRRSTGGWTPPAVVLAVAGETQRLADFLARLDDEHMLDELGRVVLAHALFDSDQHPRGARILLDNLWRTDEPITNQSGMIRSLDRGVQDARSGNAGFVPDDATTPERAILAYLSGDTADALDQLQQHTADNPDDINGARALLLVALAEDDDALAATTLDNLHTSLKEHANAYWHEPRQREPEAVAQTVLAQLQTSLNDSMALLQGQALTSAFTSMFSRNEQLVDAGTKRSELLEPHRDTLLALLAREGRLDRLEQLAKDIDTDDSSWRYSPSSYGNFPSYPGFGYPGYDDEPEDWSELVRDQLWSQNRLVELADAYADLGPWIDPDELDRAAEAAASAGRHDEAQAYRDRLIGSVLTTLAVDDGPSIEGDGSSSRWRWRWYSSGASREMQHAINALNSPPVLEDDRDDPFNKPLVNSTADTVGELALIDPRVETALLERESLVGPDWASSSTLRHLLEYHTGNQNHERVLELLDKVYDQRPVLLSEHAHAYTDACYRTKDADRLERLAGQAREFGDQLDKHAEPIRIAVMHLRNDPGTAELENTLLARTTDQPTHSFSLPDALRNIPLQNTRSGSYRRTSYYGFFGSSTPRYGPQPRWRTQSDLSTADELAAAIGVRFDNPDPDHQPAYELVHGVYRAVGAHDDAARVAKRWLNDGSRRDTREQLAMRLRIAEDLDRAGKTDAASDTIRTVRELAGAHLEQHPGDADVRTLLADSCMIADKDPARALELYQQANAIDPGIDPDASARAELAYRAGDYGLAVRLAHRSMHMQRTPSTKTLSLAAVATMRAQDRAAAQPLLDRLRLRGVSPDTILANTKDR